MTVALSFPLPTALVPFAPLDDPARLTAVAETGLVGAPADSALQRLVQHTARLIGVPTAIVGLIDERRHFIAAECGLSGWPAATRALPLTHSLCAHGVRAGAPLVIEDTRADERWADHPATTELGVVAYCGVPLRVPGGQTVGMLCASDGVPRAWTAEDVELLSDLAAVVAAELELRSANRAMAARAAVLAESERDLRTMLGAMQDVVLVLDRDGTYRRIVPTAPDLLYRPTDDVIGRRVYDVLPADTAPVVLAAVRDALDTRCPVELTYTLIAPVGPRHFAATVSPLSDDAVLWVARDVTTRAEAESARRATEARLALIYNSASDLMFLMAVERDAAGAVGGYRCESVNATYLAVTGLREDAAVGWKSSCPRTRAPTRARGTARRSRPAWYSGTTKRRTCRRATSSSRPRSRPCATPRACARICSVPRATSPRGGRRTRSGHAWARSWRRRATSSRSRSRTGRARI